VNQEPVCAFGDLELLPLDPANALNAEPVAARQREQWQFMA
jgi:hypothetical protein